MNTVFWGELLGTWSLLLIGLGLSYIDPKPNQKKIAGYWFIAVFVGNCLGFMLGSNSLNPVFLIKDLATDSISYKMFLIKFLGEILGGLFAGIILCKLPNTRRQANLGDFAVVANEKKTMLAFTWELIATLSLLFLSTAFSHIPNMLLQFLLISLWIGFLVFHVGPISGASLNPVRDLLPRVCYILYYRRWDEWRNSLASSNLAPLIAIVLWVLIH